MTEIVATIEKSASGYAAFIEELPGIAVVGETVEEVKESLKLALSMHLKGMEEDGEDIPECLVNNELVYKMDIESFFKWMSGVVSQTGLARLINLNRSLVAQYASGDKTPSPDQRKKIEHGLHKLGEDLLAIRF